LAWVAAESSSTFNELFIVEPIVSREGLPPGSSPLAQATLRRRKSFPSAEQAIASYSTKEAFRTVAPSVLEAYVRGGFRERSDGSVELKCSPHVEASIFNSHNTLVHKLAQIRCPVKVFVGEHGFFSGRGPQTLVNLSTFQNTIPNATVVQADGLGHLACFENTNLLVGPIVKCIGGALSRKYASL